MMPSDFRHQNISIFADLDTLKKEERARRRLLRIQQVRQQSKIIASQVIAKTKQIREKEERLVKLEEERRLKLWKHQKLISLKQELNYGLANLGSSHTAVAKELEEIEERNIQKYKSAAVARERGIIAAREVQKDLENELLQEEQRKQDRENLRGLENLRAKYIANLPPSSAKNPAPSEPKSKAPSTNRSSAAKSSSTESGNKVEVYNYSQPLPPQFATLPDNVVKRVSPSSCKVGAKEEAEKELQLHAEKDKASNKKKQLLQWLGGAAEARQTLQKEYSHLLERLTVLGQQEAQTRPKDRVSLKEIAKIEKEEQKKKSLSKDKSQQIPVTSVTTPLQAMEPNGEQAGAAPKQDLTAFPLDQLTAEESGALGSTASSLIALLGSLADESRRRLQEVVDDDFDFQDEDFDEPIPSPPRSPPPPDPDATSQLTVDVTTKHKVTVDGSSTSVASTVTSEVNVTVASKNKRRKKKSKNKRISNDDQPDCETVPKTLTPDQTVPMSKSSEVASVNKVKSNDVVKSIEVDASGVAFIKTTPVNTAAQVRDGSLGNAEDNQYNKHSFMSGSTQYQSPPEHLLTDENIDNYLEAIEKETKRVEAILKAKHQPVQGPNIDLPQYINKLLTMTRDNVEQLSVSSEVTESSSELSRAGRKKKKKKKAKSLMSESTLSSEVSGSQSTRESHVTLSVPSSDSLNIASLDSGNSASSNPLLSTSSEDSKLKFSESSSLKESCKSDTLGVLNDVVDKKYIENTSIHLDSTSYLSLKDLSSRVPHAPVVVPTSVSPLQMDSTSFLSLQDVSSTTTHKPILVPSRVCLNSKNEAEVFVDMPAVPHLVNEAVATGNSFVGYGASALPARLSTIIEADSSAAADSSESVDIEAELRKRGLPTLGTIDFESSSKYLSPELERQLDELKVVSWGSNMFARMKKVDSLSSSSEEIPAHVSDSSGLAMTGCGGISHSTPVSVGENAGPADISNQPQRFFLQDPIVSPIPPTDEKGSRSLSS